MAPHILWWPIRLRDRTVAILGTGRMGSAMAERLEPFSETIFGTRLAADKIVAETKFIEQIATANAFAYCRRYQTI